MFNEEGTYTVESVTSGHPDKVCDQISDAILDACLKQDPTSRVAVECLGGHGKLVIIGEVTTRADVDWENVAEKVYRDIGYQDPLEIESRIVKQSPDIALGVDTGGAGDQGIMYGYATDETPSLMPKAVVLSHQLTRGLEDLRRSGISWIKPDGKAQVTMENGSIRSILVSTQHSTDVEHFHIKKELTDKLISPLLEDLAGIEILVNPTGKFVQGGFEADTGLTGRKIMVDTYGGLIPHGGGAFSGKDPTKVDRSAAYMCRYAARKLIEEGLAQKVMVSVAYAIGRAEPLMVKAVNDEECDLSDYVKDNFDFRPQAIIERLNLRRPIYRATASYGHMGRDFPWG